MTSGDDNESIDVDFGDLVRKLVLFEQVILESIRLREFPALIHKFGYDGVKELLESGRLRIHCSGESIGHMESEPKTVGSHNFVAFDFADRKLYIHEALQPINDAPGLRGKQAQKLRKLVASRIASPPATACPAAFAQFQQDLAANSPVLKRAVGLCASRELGREVAPDAFRLFVARDGDSMFRSETDLGDLVGVDPLQAHELVAKGLLGAAGLNRRIEFMERYNSVTGFLPDELPLYEEKLSFLARQVNAEVDEHRLERVLALAGLPEVDSDPSVQDVDMPRLLEILDSDEVREFRVWLRNVDSLDDTDVQLEVSKLRDTIRHVVHSNAGKAVRFSAVTGLGLIPGAQVAALGLGALDSFVVDKVIPETGPTAFLSRLFPTIYL